MAPPGLGLVADPCDGERIDWRLQRIERLNHRHHDVRARSDEMPAAARDVSAAPSERFELEPESDRHVDVTAPLGEVGRVDSEDDRASASIGVDVVATCDRCPVTLTGIVVEQRHGRRIGRVVLAPTPCDRVPGRNRGSQHRLGRSPELPGLGPMDLVDAVFELGHTAAGPIEFCGDVLALDLVAFVVSARAFGEQTADIDGFQHIVGRVVAGHRLALSVGRSGVISRRAARPSRHR